MTAKSAMSEGIKHNTLVKEMIRRLANTSRTHPDTKENVIVAVNDFMIIRHFNIIKAATVKRLEKKPLWLLLKDSMESLSKLRRRGNPFPDTRMMEPVIASRPRLA